MNVGIIVGITIALVSISIGVIAIVILVHKKMCISKRQHDLEQPPKSFQPNNEIDVGTIQQVVANGELEPIIPITSPSFIDSDGNLVVAMEGATEQSFRILEENPLDRIRTSTLDPSDSLTLHLESFIIDKTISKVRDPYLRKFISIGSLVCVIKPFKGKDSTEFRFLQPGDLVRIVRFFVKTPKDSFKRIILLRQNWTDEIICPNTQLLTNIETEKNTREDKFDPNHEYLFCTGILLNTYLEMDRGTSTLDLKVRDEDIGNLLSDFPLNIVSLETTVLNSTVFH